MKYDYLLMTSKTYYQYHARNYMYSMHGIRQESAVKHIGVALQHGYGMESAVKHIGMALQHGYGMESAVKHIGMALQHGSYRDGIATWKLLTHLT